MKHEKFLSDEDRMITIQQVAAWIQVNASTIYRWMDEGQFPMPYYFGDPGTKGVTIRFRKGDVDEWIATRPRKKETNRRSED